MEYWFLSYHILGRTENLGSGIVSNVALAGIHPLRWIVGSKGRAPTAHRLGMVNHALFYERIDEELFNDLEAANYIPCERHGIR